MPHAQLCTAVLIVGAISACDDPHRDIDGTLFALHRPHKAQVYCAATLDGNTVDLDTLHRGMRRAKEKSEIFEIYAHVPGRTLDVAKLEATLGLAKSLELPFYTYEEVVHDKANVAGIALSFDDNSVGPWYELRGLLKKYGVRATFFVSGYAKLSAEDKRLLNVLATEDGHDIQAHSVTHADGPSYVERYGVSAYISREVVPSLQVLRDDGYEANVFAYPFGARTHETDHAIAPYVLGVRSVSFALSKRVIGDPCPH